jgi:predicted Zn-dependent peptidase
LSFSVHKTILPSGLTVVSITTPHLHSAVCAVYVRVGSRHERPEHNGVSHFLEHLFFRGSERFPDSIEMNAAVEAVGGNLNGVTMRDSSYFYTPCHPDGVPLALEVLGDMLARPRLVHLALEKKIILEEMLDEVDERGRDIDVDNLSKALLFANHPLAMKIAGTPQSVKALSRRAVLQHYRRAYVAGNMIVAVAGPMPAPAVRKEVTRAFRHVRPGPRLSEAPPPAWPTSPPRLSYVTKDEPQVEFRLSFPTTPEHHPLSVAFSTLRRVLDDGLSSRLPYNIVEKRGLAYSIGAAVELFHDAGTFEIEGACAPDHLHDVTREVFRTLATLRAGDVTQGELRRAQRRTRIHIDFLEDSPGDLCSWFGGTELYRAPETFDERARQVEALTVSDLTRAARTYLRHDRLAVVAVGPRRARRALQSALDDAARTLRSRAVTE